MKTNSTLEHIICSACGKRYDHKEILNLCSCGKVLLAKYDLEKANETVTHELTGRKSSIWRISEIMPVFDEKNQLSLGEGSTPLLPLQRFFSQKGINFYLKDEGKNPTGTFKARGLCAAVSKAVELGINEFVIPTAGNAGAALTAYCATAAVNAHVYMPKDSPVLVQKEIIAMGGDLHMVDGLISDAGALVKKVKDEKGWFDVSTMKEPYRVEGKKTMGLELAEQFDWDLRNVTIVYPTGGGTGIVGMWKAFNELKEMGLLKHEKLPRMVSVQIETCAPIVKAFKEGKMESEFWENAKTIAAGLRVPKAIGDYLILEAIRESDGTAVSVSDQDLKRDMREFALKEGIMLCPEAVAPVSAVSKLEQEGFIEKGDRVVLFGTGSGLTTPELW